MKKELTYIVTVYNQELFISECLDSLLQAMDYSELIVVDDGSQDKSWELIQNHKKKRDFLAIKQHNQGVSQARNNALLNVKTKYVTFVDGDDCIAPFDGDYINLIMSEKWDIIQYPILFNWGSANEFKNDVSKIIEENQYIESFLNKELTYSCCNKIFRTALLLDNLFPINRRYEDMYLLLSLHKYKPKTVAIPKGLYYYRYNNQSFTFSKASIQKYNDFLRVSDYYLSIVNQTSNIFLISKLQIYILIELALFKSQLNVNPVLDDYKIRAKNVFCYYYKYSKREKIFLFLKLLIGMNLTFKIVVLLFKIRNHK